MLQLKATSAAGNKWSLRALAAVILAGMAAALIPLVLKLLVHDRHTLGEESEAITIRSNTSRRSLAQNGSRASLARDSSHPLLARGSSGALGAHAAENGADASGRLRVAQANGNAVHWQDAADGTDKENVAVANGHSGIESITEPLLPLSDATCTTNGANGGASGHATEGGEQGDDDGEGGSIVSTASPLAFWVPLLVSLNDVTQGLAAGMTIKFFPIFFMDEV